MKKTIYLLIFCGFTSLATAQKLEYKGYSASMFAHSGHIKSNTFSVTNSLGQVSTHQIDNVEFGLGGKVAFQFGNYLRFGMEGYNTTTTYGNHKSTFSVGWGGLLIDFFYTDRIVSFFAGATLGGGQATNTVVTERQKLNFNTSDILRRRYVVGVMNPFCGGEVRLNDRLLLALKVDYMLRFTNTYNDWGKGFRVYLGATFRPLG
jgi:outer membrane lipoprotein-sorting protein